MGSNIRAIVYENPLFINTEDDLSSFFKKEKKKFFQTSFYKDQRLKETFYWMQVCNLLEEMDL